jgi:hypothetical protein
VLREVSQTAAQEAEARIRRQQTEEANNRTRVQSWIQKNPDLAQHGDILDFYVRQTDGRLAIESRLDAAAKRARERLIELRGKPQEANPGPQDYIPGPSGNREGAPQGNPQSVQSPVDAESQLAGYAASRNSTRFKRPGTHGR